MEIAMKRIAAWKQGSALDISSLHLTELPPLPHGLTDLYCQDNLLTALPATLPASLQNLQCYKNRLTELPATLPRGLQDMNCSFNLLTTLPATLPDSLTWVGCSYNMLTTLPSLPTGLQTLWCDNNPMLCKPTYAEEEDGEAAEFPKRLRLAEEAARVASKK